MTCRNCKFLDVAPDKSGRRVPRKERTYRCTAEISEPIWPESVPMRFRQQWMPARSFMEPDEGEGCPLWEPLP